MRSRNFGNSLLRSMNSSDTEEEEGEEEEDPNPPTKSNDRWYLSSVSCSSLYAQLPFRNITSPTDNPHIRQQLEEQYSTPLYIACEKNSLQSSIFNFDNETYKKLINGFDAFKPNKRSHLKEKADSESKVDGCDPHLRDSESGLSMHQNEQNTPLQMACSFTCVEATKAQFKVESFLKRIKDLNIKFKVPKFSESTDDLETKINKLKEVLYDFGTNKVYRKEIILCMHDILFTNFLGLKFVPKEISSSFKINYFNYIANDADKIIAFVEANRKNIAIVFFANYKHANEKYVNLEQNE